MGLIDVAVVPHSSQVYHAYGRYVPYGIDHKRLTPCGMFWYTNEVNAEVVGEDEAWDLFRRRPCMHCYRHRYSTNSRTYELTATTETLNVERKWT